MFAGGFALATQHAGEFLDAGFAVEKLDLREGAAVFDLLGDDEVAGGGRGDGGEVGDAKNLMLPGDAAHFVADGDGGFAADIGINFVENQDRDLVLGGEDGFEGEHHAGHLSGGRDGAQGTRRFAGIGGELKFDRVEAVAGRGEVGEGEFLGGDTLEGDVELALLKAEVGEVTGGGFGKLGDYFATAGGEVGAGLPEFGVELVESGLKAGEFGFALFEACEFLAGGLTGGDDVGEGAAVFAL